VIASVRSFFLAAIAAAALVSSAFAADIKIVDDPRCAIMLRGEIEAGDAEVLKKRIKGKRPDSFKERLSFCLSSPGGSYPEALKIIDVLLEAQNIGTVVKRDAQCFSACALVFLAGSYHPGDSEDPKYIKKDRILFPGGKLGFHAPYAAGLENTPASQQTVGTAVKVGIDAIIDLLDRNELKLFPDKLLRKAMRLGPREMYEISTVRNAIEADIFLPQLTSLPPVDDAAAIRACKNALMAEGTGFQTVEGVTKQKVADVERYIVTFGFLEQLCDVTVAGPADRLLVWVRTSFGDDELTEDRAKDLRLDVGYAEFGSQWYYLLDGNTPISTLRGDGKAKPIISTPMMHRSYDFMGTDIGAVTADSDYACAVQCAEQGTCKAFSYNHWAKKCFLKSSFDRSRFDPRSVSGNFTGAGNSGAEPQTVQKFRGRKFKNIPYYTGDAVSFDDCLKMCLTQSGCIAVNFRKSDKQCDSFSEVDEYFPDADYDAAMRWEAP
jgi:hypothetical protein